jgi:hypothetical protein
MTALIFGTARDNTHLEDITFIICIPWTLIVHCLIQQRLQLCFIQILYLWLLLRKTRQCKKEDSQTTIKMLEIIDNASSRFRFREISFN